MCDKECNKIDFSKKLNTELVKVKKIFRQTFEKIKKDIWQILLIPSLATGIVGCGGNGTKPNGADCGYQTNHSDGIKKIVGKTVFYRNEQHGTLELVSYTHNGNKETEICFVPIKEEINSMTASPYEEKVESIGNNQE